MTTFDERDRGPFHSKLVVTHCDQLGWEDARGDFLSNGRTRNHVVAVRT